MRTRIHEWLELHRLGKFRLRATVLYGVQVHDHGRWKHAHRNGKPLLFKTRERADKERAKLRALEDK